MAERSQARLKSNKNPRPSRRDAGRRGARRSAHGDEAVARRLRARHPHHAHRHPRARRIVGQLQSRRARAALGFRASRAAPSISASLTTLMIDAAKADAGAVILREEVFRPRRLVAALADSLSARAETKGLAAEVAVATTLPEMLVGDAVRLRAALENLIDNAVKFTERGAVRIDVRAARASARARQAGLYRHRQRHRPDACRDQASGPPVHPGERRYRAPLRRHWIRTGRG